MTTLLLLLTPKPKTDAVTYRWTVLYVTAWVLTVLVLILLGMG